MMRGLCGVMLSAGLGLLSTGCTMCQQPLEDYTYAAYGGVVQRADMTHGRVGSAFTPAEGAPGHVIEHDPLLPPPEYIPASADPAAAQATSTAFDPGDILESAPN
jgi:hypothetical protein